jgi:hypothetical protein
VAKGDAITRQLVAAVLLSFVIAVSLASSWSLSASHAASACRVTIPTRTVPPSAGFTRAGFNYGGAYLRAHLYWPNGTLYAGALPGGGSMAAINPDGSISVKLGWWRGRRGELVIRGRRLDATAAPLRADVPNGSYGATGFIPSGITFPTTGCWRVTGTVGSATLSFTVKVRKLRPRS